MAGRRRRSDDDGQPHRCTEKRRRLHILANHCGDQGLSIYKLNVDSHAVHPDGATVFLSLYKTGTFSFDGERLAWARHGDWLLPFDGEAYYVRALDAWVGLCSRHRGRIAACKVIDDDRRDGAEPVCKSGKDLLFRQNAGFCLQETLTREGDDHHTTFGLIVPVLLRVVNFRVQYSWDGELCVVNRRARIYKLPYYTSGRKPLAFWI